ncbi:MAG: PAS domain-containing protein, partial [Pseudomonadota bacterium]
MPLDLRTRIFEMMLNGIAYHRIVVDAAGQPVDYVFLELNDAFERMTGLVRDRVVGRRASEVLPGIAEDDAGWIARYGAVALTGVDARFERYSDVLGRWFSVVAYCPEPEHFVTIFEDITERVEAAGTRREGARSLRTLMANLPGMVYRCRNEPSWPMDVVSEGCAELTGYPPERLMVGGDTAYGDLIHADDRERVWQAVQDAVDGRWPCQIEYRIRAE